MIPIQVFEKEFQNSDMKKNLLKMINPEIECYERLKAMFLCEWYLFKQGENSWYSNEIRNGLLRYKELRSQSEFSRAPDSLLKQEVGYDALTTTISFMFTMGKRIRVNKEISELAMNTDNKISSRLLPHNLIMIESFIKDVVPGVDVLGIILDMRGRVIVEDTMIEDYSKIPVNFKITDENVTNKIIIFGIDNRDKSNFYLKDSISPSGWHLAGEDDPRSQWKNKDEVKIIKDKVAIFAYNIIDLINHPEVETIKTDNSYLRQKRISEGRFGVPDIIDINLTGKLKKYVYEEIPKQKEVSNKLNHRFWVRGHFVNFRSDRYKSAKGTTKWIMPFIKGRGELVNRKYSIGKSDDWYHQKLMVSLIRNIYPDKKVKVNTRTILNGLEIDCYLPELKLGFEYNGEQHYNWIQEFHKTELEFNQQKERDILKRKLAIEKGIKLITVKYDEPLTEELLMIKIKEVENGK